MVSLQSQPTYWKVRTKILKNLKKNLKNPYFNKLNLCYFKIQQGYMRRQTKRSSICWLNSLNNVICNEIGGITLFVIKNDKNRWA